MGFISGRGGGLSMWCMSLRTTRARMWQVRWGLANLRDQNGLSCRRVSWRHAICGRASNARVREFWRIAVREVEAASALSRRSCSKWGSGLDLASASRERSVRMRWASAVAWAVCSPVAHRARGASRMGRRSVAGRAAV